MRIIWKLLEVLICFRRVSTIPYFHYVIYRRTNFQVSHLTLSISRWYFYFSRWGFSSLITWKIRRFVFKKSSSYTELQWQWLLLDRQRGPRSLFKSWHLKGPDTSQSLNISPGPGKFILTTELLCCLLTHVPDGFLFLVTEWLPRSRVHDWTFTLHFSTVYYAIH